jgi:hypothetical protein
MTKFRCTVMDFVAYLRMKYLLLCSIYLLFIFLFIYLFFPPGPNSEEEMLRGEPRIVLFQHMVYG